MHILVTWSYNDPANGGLYADEKCYRETSLEEAIKLWLSEYAEILDHVISVGFSK